MKKTLKNFSLSRFYKPMTNAPDFGFERFTTLPAICDFFAQIPHSLPLLPGKRKKGGDSKVPPPLPFLSLPA
jgi:hypothetical protein